MQHRILLVYVVLYALAAIVLVVGDALIATDPVDPIETPLERIVDSLLYFVGLAGMILLLIGSSTPALRTAWKPVAIVLVVSQAWINLAGWRSWRHAPTWRTFKRGERIGLTVFLLLFLVPSLALNLLYAFR